MNKFLVIVLMLGLAACGQGPKGERGDDGLSAPIVVAPPVSDAVQADIDAVLAAANKSRLKLGQTKLSVGLSCALSTVTGGDRIQASIAGHNTLTGISQVATFLHADVFNQLDSPVNSQMNVLPAALRPIYLNMYLLRCQGQIVVLEDDYYNFELSSDDGSLLYLDGAKVIDNDNNHGTTTVMGMRFLTRGIHSFRLDYAQTGGGNQSLILKANGNLIEGRYYAH